MRKILLNYNSFTNARGQIFLKQKIFVSGTILKTSFYSLILCTFHCVFVIGGRRGAYTHVEVEDDFVELVLSVTIYLGS